LHGHAEKGDYVAAEEVLKGMRKAKFPPGPRAFHALVYSYVRGGNSAGALKAIKEEAAKGKEVPAHMVDNLKFERVPGSF
jgi:pentatricopeptide repeat protein